MKKIYLLLTLLTAFTFLTIGQQVFEFEFQIDEKIKDEQVVGDVTITLLRGPKPVNYQLMPPNDYNGKAIFESGFCSKDKYKFKNVPAGTYLAKVVDRENRMTFHQIVIGEN